MSLVTRFAPSPTGYLHLGHARSALLSAQRALREGGQFILRLEDIDHARCRSDYADAVLEDLAWLGLTWPMPVRRQSEHASDFAAALARLEALGLVYPCFCSRSDFHDRLPAIGPDGPVYDRYCHSLPPRERAARLEAGEEHCLRLDHRAAMALTGPLAWQDELAGPQQARPEFLGDVVLAGREIGTSYHLSVTVDDALQGITHVIRGEDLFHATHMHRLLQAALGLPAPVYHHHALVLDPATGNKLSKRDGSATLRSLREEGLTPADIARLAGMETTPP
jgi:glutamyl-Q tRNA(Asp) synthetase